MTIEQAQRDALAVFARRDWGMFLGVVLLWGTSFLLVDIALDDFAPPLIAFGRIAFGAAALALLPAGRVSVPRAAWPSIAVVGVTWMAVPFLLIAVAQQWIDTGRAGMINASTPLFTAVLGGLLVRMLPSRLQIAGLMLGFLGVIAISLPTVQGRSNPAAVGLLLTSAAFYGLAFNLAAPLQHRHGSLAVTWRALLVAAVVLLPVAAVGAVKSSFAWDSLLAVVALGALSTGVAYNWFSRLITRVGPARASVTIYGVPVIAVALGAALNNERVHPAALLGAAMVLYGAYLTSRPKRE